ncbi:MAG: hypothetical protein H6642_00110 [Caldilineaceae bacterium]|nr:hypothetical protein [Caldilineaceae bacterium]
MKRFIVVLVVLMGLVACGGGAEPTTDDVVAAFEQAGLECVDPHPGVFTDDSLVPKTFEEVTVCELPSQGEDDSLAIYRFSSEENLKQVKDFYEGFSGLFGSYLYQNGNLLVQTFNTMPIELAEQYDEALQSVGK